MYFHFASPFMAFPELQCEIFDVDISFRSGSSKFSHSLPSVWPLYLFLSTTWESSFKMTEQGTNLWIYQNVIVSHLLRLFLFVWNHGICFCPRSLGYLVSGSQLTKQCLKLVISPGMGLKSDQILIGYSHKFCDNKAQTLHLGCCLYFSFCSVQSAFLY